MASTDETSDPRLQANATTAKRLYSNEAMGGAGLFAESPYRPIYGRVKGLKFWASDDPADATFVVTIRDVDDAVVYTSGAITKNQFTYVNLTQDESIQLCGLYKVRFTFGTSQTLAANLFQLLPTFK